MIDASSSFAEIMNKGCYPPRLGMLPPAVFLVMEKLLQGADPNAMDEATGKRPLHDYLSSPHKKLETLRILLSHGADPNLPDGNGRIAWDTFYGAEITGIMIRAGMDVDLKVHGASSVSDFLTRTHKEKEARWNNKYRIAKPFHDPLYKRCDDILKLLHHYESLPNLDDAYRRRGIRKRDVLSKDALFAADANGFCMLDNPDSWHRFGEMVERLENNGEVLTLDDLLHTNRDGKSWLEMAVECFSLPQVLRYCSANGQYLQKHHLRTENGEETPLLRTLAENGAIGHLLTYEVNKGRNPHDYKKLFSSIPEAYHWQRPPVMHQVMAALRADCRGQFQRAA